LERELALIFYNKSIPIYIQRDTDAGNKNILTMDKLAQFGTVDPPPGVNRFSSGDISGLPLFLNVILKTLIMGAGIFALFNFIFAGYEYLSAQAEPEKIQRAQARIWQTIIGLLIAAGAFIIAAIIGLLIFGNANAILQIKIFGPP
jgi:hypothetical protein